jgi:ubiquinone biosynthesis protein
MRDTSRLREILFAFGRHGFASWIKQTKLYDYYSAGRRLFMKDDSAQRSPAERFRKVLEELGPTFVKLGQILSTRNDILPEDWTRELSMLLDQVPPAPIEEIEKFVERELGKPIAEVFRRFDREPFAAASIGQVYDAELKDGTPVVVKVQRPGVQEIVEKDLEIMAYLADLAEKYIEAARDFNVKGVVREFSRYLRREMDFVVEQKNMERFRENFRENPNVYIPRVYPGFTTRRVIVIEKVQGAKLKDLKADAVTRRELARTGARALLQQVFMDGLFHADPHPGNIFIVRGNVIAFIDFGMAGRIEPSARRALGAMLSALSSRDADRITRIFLKVGSPSGKVDMRELRLDIADFLDKYYGSKLRSMPFGEALSDMLAIIRKYHIHIPAEYTMVLKALLTVEKVAVNLDGEFDFTEEVEPFVKKMFLRRFSPEENIAAGARMLEETADFMEELPEKAQGILRKLHDGELTFEFRHSNIDRLVDEISRASSRVSFALVILSIMIASSVMITLGKTDLLKWAGFAGYMMAGILGSVLLFSAIFRGKL